MAGERTQMWPENSGSKRVAVCGDWHGNLGWLRTLARAIPRLAPDVTTVLQLGDWWMDRKASDDALSGSGIERVLVTLGNHEPWGELSPLLAAHPEQPVQVSEFTWVLPRPFRFELGGRRFLSLGGAASVDRLWRTPGKEWWPDEAITDEQVASAIAGGPADVMLTHESPARTPVRRVQEVLRTNPMGFPQETLLESAASRVRVARVWDAVRPELLMHGHMHIAGGGMTDDGRRVSSFGMDDSEGNLAFLNLETLRLEFPRLAEIRAAAL